MARLKEKLGKVATNTHYNTSADASGTATSANGDKKSEEGKATDSNSSMPVGIHGVRLKRFETVVAKLLSSVEPKYVRLPPVPSLDTFQSTKDGDSQTTKDTNDDWLFSDLPQSARVVGNHPNQKRAKKKEGQLLSMLRCVLQLVPPSRDIKTTTIVDFGGGSGHLGIPLAILLPHCRIVVVDFNARSIDLMHDKAEKVVRDTIESSSRDVASAPKPFPASSNLRCCGSGKGGVLDNLFTYTGPVEDFEEDFDVAIALHLCGQATDVCLRKAVLRKASSIVVAPCCVGKLSLAAFNPDVYRATGQNSATVTYPQSALFCQVIKSDASQQKQEGDWNALAKAADYSNENEFRSSRNASRRTAKALLETDRRLFLESNQYRTALMKMKPLEVTPKNDILVAWRPEVYNSNQEDTKQSLFSTPDNECQADIEVAKAHLLLASSSAQDALALPSHTITNKETSTISVDTTHQTTPVQGERNDWTQEEEEEIKKTIADFFIANGNNKETNTNTSVEASDPVLVFPTRMGGRKRKLIHYVAGQLNLAHWGQGKKVSEKTVAVAKSRPRKPAN